MLRALAAELGRRGVRVNTIAPGAVETPLTAQMKAHPDWYDAYAQKSVFGRWAKPHEIVGMMIYLASDASSYVTGAFMLVDGGWTAVDGLDGPAPAPTWHNSLTGTLVNRAKRRAGPLALLARCEREMTARTSSGYQTGVPALLRAAQDVIKEGKGREPSC